MKRGDRGTAIVATLTLSFVFMAGAFIWLSRTVDRSLHDRSQAAAVAFQAARAGAQQVEPSSLYGGDVIVDRERAIAAARQTVAQLLTSNGDRGELISVSVTGARVTVTVSITSTGRPAEGSGTATARAGFEGPDG